MNYLVDKFQYESMLPKATNEKCNKYVSIYVNIICTKNVSLDNSR